MDVVINVYFISDNVAFIFVHILCMQFTYMCGDVHIYENASFCADHLFELTTIHKILCLCENMYTSYF